MNGHAALAPLSQHSVASKSVGTVWYVDDGPHLAEGVVDDSVNRQGW